MLAAGTMHHISVANEAYTALVSLSSQYIDTKLIISIPSTPSEAVKLSQWLLQYSISEMCDFTILQYLLLKNFNH